MRKREKEIESYLKKGDKNYTAAFNKMVPIYKFLDYTDKTNHCYVISLIYNRSVNRYSIRKITFLASMSDSTLKRNRKKYVECFDYFLNQLDNREPNDDAIFEIAPSQDDKE